MSIVESLAIELLPVVELSIIGLFTYIFIRLITYFLVELFACFLVELFAYFLVELFTYFLVGLLLALLQNYYSAAELFLRVVAIIILWTLKLSK